MPGYEGRAGMVAIRKLDGPCDINLVKLAEYVNEHLPKYARPLFLRIIHQPQNWDLVTSTLKLRRVELQR